LPLLVANLPNACKYKTPLKTNKEKSYKNPNGEYNIKKKYTKSKKCTNLNIKSYV
jgi:hypothetical protein